MPGPDLVLRLAALLHDIGKPATRRFEAGGGVSFHHHEVVGAKLVARRLKALRFDKETVQAVARLIELHLRFHGYGDGRWTDSAVRRYVTDAGPLLERLHRLTRSDCTTRNRRKADRLLARLRRPRARGSPSCASRRRWRRSARTSTASRSWRSSGCRRGREVGEAYRFLLELRMEEGPLPPDAAEAALRAWWAERAAGRRRRRAVRLWSVHPRYLDTAGLTACWREALLAQKVLTGVTRGYRHHPQLERFLPGSALAAQLAPHPRNRPDVSVQRADPDETSAQRRRQGSRRWRRGAAAERVAAAGGVQRRKRGGGGGSGGARRRVDGRGTWWSRTCTGSRTRPTRGGSPSTARGSPGRGRPSSTAVEVTDGQLALRVGPPARQARRPQPGRARPVGRRRAPGPAPLLRRRARTGGSVGGRAGRT